MKNLLFMACALTLVWACLAIAGAAITPSYTFNGVRFADAESVKPVAKLIQLHAIPSPAQSLMLYRNGILQTQGADYTLAGSTATLLTTPDAADAYIAFYRY